MTTTPTSTVQSCSAVIASAADNSCNNSGAQWAYWTDPQLAGAVDPGVLRTTSTLADGVANPATELSFWYGNCDSYAPYYISPFYNANEICVYFAFGFRGFVYAATAGDYVFTLTAADDLVNAWIGDDDIVRSGYSLDNINISNRGGDSLTYTYTAVAGEYIPMRVVLNQVTGPWAQAFTIVAPDGSYIVGPSGATSNFVQFGCNGATFSWLPWGSETSS